MSKFLDAALEYADKGLAVIPTKPKTNKPFLDDWPNVATTNKYQIIEWWEQNPNYNVAIVTGRKNHLLVVDLDLDEEKGKYGYELAKDWQREHKSSFPEDSWLVKSAHGGYHFYFQSDEPQGSPQALFFKNSGVDIRADGACIVAPPSVREDGKCYEWEQSPDEFELKPANDAVWEFIRDGEAEKAKNEKKQKAENDQKGNTSDEIPEGARTDALVSMIGSMRLQKHSPSDEAIRAAVKAENEERCNPPLTDEELEKQVFPALTRDWKPSNPITPKAVPDKGMIDKLIELDAANTFSQTDKGFAELYVAMFGDVSRYNPTKREYMYYDGIRWALDLESLRAKNNAKKLADALRSYAGGYTNLDDKQLVEYTKQVLKLMSNRAREVMVKDARDLNFFQSEQLDEDDYLLNCRNGVLDLSGPEPRFFEHDSKLLLSKVCNAEYDADARSELWEKSLAEIMEEDAEKIDYIQKLLGLALTGCAKEEELYFFYGSTSRNGKSTIAETILYLLGDYGATISPESLQAKTRDSRQASPDMAKLQGVRLVVASEPPKRMLFDVSLVKTLTGRDSITARNLYESEISFVPKFKLLINTNYLPLITDDTIFKSERIRVIDFNRHFGPEEQNKNLKEELRDELSGILNWMLEGWHKYQEEGLEPPPIIEEATEEYRKDSDKIGRFISDCLVEVKGSNLPAKDVYEHYVEWCDDSGHKPEGRNNFYNELKSRGIFRESGTIKARTVRNIVAGYGFAEEEFTELEEDEEPVFE